jgi:hypothetical protein
MYFLTCGLYSHSAWKQYESQVVVPWTLVPISWQLVTCNPAQTVQLVAGRFKRSRVAVPSKRVLSVKLLEHLSIRLRSEMLPSDLPSHLDSSVISHLAAPFAHETRGWIFERSSSILRHYSVPTGKTLD